MAEVFLESLIKNLPSLIQRQIGVIMGVDKEMKKLSSTLATIQSVLEDAEEKQLQNKPIQNWLIKLNNIVYEIDDILDECATEVLKREHKGSKFNPKKIYRSLKIGGRMKEMAQKLDALAAERHDFHLREIIVPQSSKVDLTRETISVLNEPDHVYGRDEDREKIVDMLVTQVADYQQLSVLPIIGLGGLGKTTLAQFVYNDERVTQHFPTRLWVCVSDNFDLMILLKAMIQSATGSASNLTQLDALQSRVREVLNQKKYLLILDDVWNEDPESWATLKSILACGSKGSSVVVTTRLKTVATAMGTLQPHRLKGLSEEDCWSLFRLRAFGPESEELPNLEEIGRRIVKKCAGVPLAAKALGRLLRFTKIEQEWIRVEKTELWDFPEEKISILPVLRLSYHHLPLELRRCFVYCAVFPKDSKIEKQDLIFRWMAHGCISSTKIQEVEDVGDQRWNELVWRSFFQEVETRGKETTFKMHDLVHDLAQSIMENKISRAQMETSSASESNSKIREVYLGEGSEISLSTITLQVPTVTPVINYIRLRILKLNETEIEEVPSAIGKLKHLRYLDLSHSSIHTLPHGFCGLWNLQILILDYCSNLKSLPKHTRYLTNLRHIFLEGCLQLSHMPSRIGELVNLRTLNLFIIGHEKGSCLGELENLNLGGRLEIKYLERIQIHMNAKKANLVNKPNLRDLVLDWEGNSTSELAKATDEKVLDDLEPHPNLVTLKIHGFKGSNFPLWMKKMKNLTRITIRNCPTCSRLPPLGDLPCLKSLHLENLVGLEYIVEDEIRDQSSVQAKFPSLEYLNLKSLPNVNRWLKEEVGELILFPNLRSLYIDDYRLLIFPFSKLENLSLLHMSFEGNTRTCNIPEESLGDLCCLKELEVRYAGEYRLPEKWFRGLKSLTKLTIRSSNIGSGFPEGWLRHLTALEELSIWFCRELVEVPEEIKYLHLLKRLQLYDLNNLVSLPQGLQHLPSLQSLHLFFLTQLTLLPDWLGNLTSLEVLDIMVCPKVPLLPSTIQGMTNLRFLSIWGCPQLARRCKEEDGEDWHKIAHIPDLFVKQD